MLHVSARGHRTKLERIDTLEAADVVAVRGRVGAALAMRVDAAVRAEPVPATRVLNWYTSRTRPYSFSIREKVARSAGWIRAERRLIRQSLRHGLHPASTRAITQIRFSYDPDFPPFRP